jgi:type IV pilus assembly protein PilM
MLKSKSFLAVDFGAGSLKLAEFEVNESGGLRLKQFGLKPLGADGMLDSKREAAVKKALDEMIAEKGIKAKTVNVCARGFDVFSKFVKLPAVETGKISQIIQYEAQQNVPFPLQEVVWDYQILGTSASGELEVLLVAIKSDVIEKLFKLVDQEGLRLNVADVSPAALCNAFRYNYGDVEECSMLLDIGAKTSSLLFFEKGKVFSRSINLGANAITQDFINESKKGWAHAEDFKIKEGFVSLGGAYAEPESEQQAALSKIARQFMTRLHIQVNQTMQFYKGQQGGAMPQRLYLSGGASIMTYTAQFFAEKLNIPVEYLNPFRNVEIDPALSLEDLARVAHSMGEVVGLGLRNLATCPVELNLMPKTTRRLQAFDQKKPYLVATVFCVTLVVFAMGYLYGNLAEIKAKELEQVQRDLGPLQARAQEFTGVTEDLKKVKAEQTQMVTWINDRYYWADVLKELHRVLVQTETKAKAKLGDQDTGLWVERFITVKTDTESSANPFDPSAVAPADGTPPMYGPYGGMSPVEREMMMRRYFGGMRGRAMPPAMAPAVPEAVAPEPAAPAPAVAPDGAQAVSAAAPAGATNEISEVTLRLRAVNMVNVNASANNTIVFSFIEELRSSPLTAEEVKGAKEPATRIDGEMGAEEAPGTFTFKVIWKLRRPMKL